MKHKVDELIKLDLAVAILVQLCEELVDISLRRLLIDSCFFEMHFKQIGNFFSVKYAIAILVKRIKGHTHLLDTLAAHRLRVLIHLHHHLVLAHEVLHIVLTVLH